MSQDDDTSANDSDDDTTMTSSSSCKVSSLPASSNVSSEVWERVVSKAQAIASDPASISPVPGGNGKVDLLCHLEILILH